MGSPKVVAISVRQSQETIMTGSAFPRVLHEDYCVDPAAIGNWGVPAGTFLLRRTHYLNEIERDYSSRYTTNFQNF
jgi:hypothetical protein